MKYGGPLWISFVPKYQLDTLSIKNEIARLNNNNNTKKKLDKLITSHIIAPK